MTSARIAVLLWLFLTCSTFPAFAQQQAYKMTLNPESGSGWSCPGGIFWGLTPEELGASVRKYWNHCGKGDVPGSCVPGIPSHFKSRNYTHESYILNAGATVTWHFTVSDYNILSCTIETISSGETFQVPKVTPEPGCVPPASPDPAAPWRCICPTCLACVGTYCVPDDSQVPPQISPNDCKEEYCSGGALSVRNSDTELPMSPCKQCKNGLQTSVADWTRPRNDTERCHICKGGNVATLPKHTTSYQDLSKCPDGSTQDANAPFEVDGCTNSPDDLESWDSIALTANYDLYVANPIFGTIEGSVPRSRDVQPFACNRHDACYQTCGKSKGSCDAALSAGITASCDTGYPPACPYNDLSVCEAYRDEYRRCREIGPVYLAGVNNLLGKYFYERNQVKNCFCCQPAVK